MEEYIYNDSEEASTVLESIANAATVNGFYGDNYKDIIWVILDDGPFTSMIFTKKISFTLQKNDI